MVKLYFYKTRVALGILCLSVALTITLTLFENRLHQNVDDLQHHLSTLHRIAVQSQEAAMLMKTHEKDFAAFELCEFERPCTSEGLQSSRARSIEFGPNSVLKDNSKTSDLVVQEVSFSIPCLQDRDVFALLEELTNKGPGIFHTREVTVKRVSSLSEEMLEKIVAGKPQTLFEGRIRATWIHR
jgi:hypothetical protein